MSWIGLLSELGAFTIAVGALGWLARELGSRWLDNRVEVFREQLRRETSEHQIRFESLHRQRAEALLLIWRSLKKAHAYVGGFTSPMQFGGKEQQDKLGDEAKQAVVALNQAIHENLIFFPKLLADRIATTSKQLDSLWYGAYLDYSDARKEGRNPYFNRQDGSESDFGQAWDKLSKEVGPLTDEMEIEFRKLLGV